MSIRPQLHRRARALVALCCGVALLTTASIDAAAAVEPTPPARPAAGQLGGDGPCGQSQIALPSALFPENQVWVFSPTGAAAPRTGGACGDSVRPVVFLAHGWSGIAPRVYADLIQNLTSNGYVVAFANYGPVDSALMPAVAKAEIWAGFRQSTRMTGRMDLDHLGVWGHSYGGGMAPWIAAQAAAQGWGGESLWAAQYDPYNGHPLGGPFGDEPVGLPGHARAITLAYETGGLRRGAVEMFHRLGLPADRKVFIDILGDCHGQDPCAYPADHMVPVSWNPYPPWNQNKPEDHLDHYGTYRNVQVLADCARNGTFCGTDLSYMGAWSDGVPATPADVTQDPQ